MQDNSHRFWVVPTLYGYILWRKNLMRCREPVESPEAGPLARVLRIRPLQWMGMVSYGFYLWHYPVLHVLQTVTQLKKPLFVLYAGSLTLLFTVISWYGVEQVFQKYKKLKYADTLQIRQPGEIRHVPPCFRHL